MIKSIHQIPKSHPIYTAEQIKSWEARWFAQGNTSYGLMQQAALMMATTIENLIVQSKEYNYLSTIMVWCGAGNNGGDGYLIAKYLKQKNFDVFIYAKELPNSPDAQKARLEAQLLGIAIYETFDDAMPSMDIHVDALFGNGLNQELSLDYQVLFFDFNAQKGLKIAVDIPSGLHPDTGMALPYALKVDYTLCVMGLKMGLLTGAGRYYAGKVISIPLIPMDDVLQPVAYIDTYLPTLPPRIAHAHKGHFGHVLIIGGHANMGGAVIMAGESAIACGAGKVTIMCHKHHHCAILGRSPNIMVKDIDDIFDHEQFSEYLKHIDVVAFGMGLGRDGWAYSIYQQALPILQEADHLLGVVMDADGLYFLSQSPERFNHQWTFTPHTAEAGRLLYKTADDIEQHRMQAIDELQLTYGGNWVLKGAGSLSLETNQQGERGDLHVCAFGNAGMASAGMGDALSGIIAGLKPLLIPLEDCVALHALAGDTLASQGQRGINAYDMPKAIYQVIN